MDSSDLLARTPSPRSKSPADPNYMLDEEDEDEDRPIDDSLIDFGFESPDKKRRRPSKADVLDDRQRTPSPTPIDDILSGVPTLPRRGSRSSMGMVPGAALPRASITRQPTLPQSPPSPQRLSPAPDSLSRSSSHRSLIKPPTASSDFGQQVSDAELSEDSGKLLDPDRYSSDRQSDRHSEPDRLSDRRPDSRHSDRHSDSRRPDSRHSDHRRPDSRHSDRRRPDSRHSDGRRPPSRESGRHSPRPDSSQSDRHLDRHSDKHSDRHSDMDRLSDRQSDIDQQSSHSRHSDPDDIDMCPPPPPPQGQGQSQGQGGEGSDGEVYLGDTSMKSTRV